MGQPPLVAVVNAVSHSLVTAALGIGALALVAFVALVVVTLALVVVALAFVVIAFAFGVTLFLLLFGTMPIDLPTSVGTFALPCASLALVVIATLVIVIIGRFGIRKNVSVFHAHAHAARFQTTERVRLFFLRMCRRATSSRDTSTGVASRSRCRRWMMVDRLVETFDDCRPCRCRCGLSDSKEESHQAKDKEPLSTSSWYGGGTVHHGESILLVVNRWRRKTLPCLLGSTCCRKSKRQKMNEGMGVGNTTATSTKNVAVVGYYDTMEIVVTQTSYCLAHRQTRANQPNLIFTKKYKLQIPFQSKLARNLY